MRKAAKVYEASESVEGNKPKVVYESHKKCTPGEFGMHVKEALAKTEDSDADKSPAANGRNDRRQRARNRAEDLAPMEGFGRGYADYLLPSTFGGTRAGRATMIAKALGKKPDFSVSNPNTDTLLSALGGGIFGGVGGMALGGLTGALTGRLDNAATGAMLGGGLGYGLGNIAGIAGSGMQRREQMQKIQDSLADELEQHGTSRLKLDAPQYSMLSSILQPLSGAHRAGQADAYEALRDNTRYKSTPGRTAAYLAAHVPYAGPLVNVGHGMAQNFSARSRMKQERAPIADEYGLKEFGPAKAAYAFGAQMKVAFEKAAIPSFGGRNYSLAPRGFGVGLNAGYDYLGGVVPAPYVGVDVGTPHTGMMLSGPIPGIGIRSGMFTRPPGATSGHNRSSLHGHRSLWKYLADSYSGRDPKDVEDEVHDDRMQSLRNVTKDEFHEAIPEYHEGPKGKPLSKDLHKALTEYYHRNSRPEKKSAYEFGEKLAAGGVWGKALGMASKAMGSAPVPRVATGKVINGATGQLMSGGPKPAPSWLTKNRDAQATAMSKARSAVPGAVPPSSPPPFVGFGQPAPYTPQGRLMQDMATRPKIDLSGMFPTPKPTMIKTQSAYAFGQKAAFNIDWSALKNPMIGGAALGAVAGGAHGLMSPGEDEHGNQRSRFGAMLRGALGGGALGTAGGAVAGHFAPTATNNLINNLRYQYTMRTPVPTPAQAQSRQNFTAAGEEPHIEGDVMNPAMQNAQG